MSMCKHVHVDPDMELLRECSAHVERARINKLVSAAPVSGNHMDRRSIDWLNVESPGWEGPSDL